ncbi:MAG: GAF domain-containing protein, partial [Candidatus Dormibacterales bacterium]
MPSPARRRPSSHTRTRPVEKSRSRLNVKPGRPQPTRGPSAAAIVHELSSCVTEADLVQVLYRGLHTWFGYEVVLLQVLEGDGYRSVPIDSGVLQDVYRRPVSESQFAGYFSNPVTAVVPMTESSPQEIGKGPGTTRYVKFAIWVPVMHQGELIGSVIYQSYRKRRVPESEVTLLNQVHSRLGVMLANASLNALTRNQARRLEALNSVARAMTSTLDESSVLTGLHATLRELLPVDSVEMVTFQDAPDRVRLLHVQGQGAPSSRWLAARSALAATARSVMQGNKPVLEHQPTSSLWVPLKEGGVARGALGITCKRPYSYEDSTAAFLVLVSDEVALALRNARSYEAIEAQRRRLEVVNSIGRGLASSLDRWSIMRTLREELAKHLSFDGFILAAITETPEGPRAEGYQYVAGVEEVVPPVALAVTGPSREAYES